MDKIWNGKDAKTLAPKNWYERSMAKMDGTTTKKDTELTRSNMIHSFGILLHHLRTETTLEKLRVARIERH